MPNPPGFCQYPDEWHTFQTTTLGFPQGEAKGQLRKLLLFNEPLNFPTLRADAIRPYSSADEVK